MTNAEPDESAVLVQYICPNISDYYNGNKITKFVTLIFRTGIKSILNTILCKLMFPDKITVQQGFLNGCPRMET